MAATNEPLPGILTNLCARTDAKPADKVTQGILREVISPDPITARHALALAVDLARKVIMTASQQGGSFQRWVCWAQHISLPCMLLMLPLCSLSRQPGN